MEIQPIMRRTLADVVAGRLVSLLLEGAMRPGAQLPPERELMNRLSVSHATLREALKALAEDKLIEARPGVGWFAREVGILLLSPTLRLFTARPLVAQQDDIAPCGKGDVSDRVTPYYSPESAWANVGLAIRSAPRARRNYHVTH